MKTNFTLTLGIPVYNGQEQLQQTLSSIENLTEFQKGRVQVVVSDNNSKDSSLEVAKEFQARFPGLSVAVCNKANEYMLGNLWNILKHSKGRFVWFLGVGEQINTCSLTRLLGFLNSSEGSECAFGVVSAELSSNYHSEDALDSWEIEHFPAFKGDCYSETISCVIVNRNFGLQVLGPKTSDARLEDSFWPHLELAIVATKHSTFRVSRPVLISIADNEDGWWFHGDRFLSIYAKQLEVLDLAVGHLGTRWWGAQLLENRRSWRFAAAVFETCLNGKKVSSREVWMIRKFGIRPITLLVSILITLAPRRALIMAQELRRLFIRE